MSRDCDTTPGLVWIHPEFNAQFCHYYDEKPGDLANFYLFKETRSWGTRGWISTSLDEFVGRGLKSTRKVVYGHKTLCGYSAEDLGVRPRRDILLHEAAKRSSAG